MNKIKEILEELAGIQLNRAKEVSKKIPSNPDHSESERQELLGSAKVLGIITSALVELGVSESTNNKVKQDYLDLPICDWDGKPIDQKIKVKEESIMGYEVRFHNDGQEGSKDIEIIEVFTVGRSFTIRMTIQEFEEFVYGK